MNVMDNTEAFVYIRDKNMQLQECVMKKGNWLASDE